jgi:rhodanese-related sulfurtransferase
MTNIDQLISCTDLAALMASRDLYAVFDVRERGEYNDGQIPGATCLPRSQIEFRIAALVPDRAVPMVVYDEGGERAALALATLRRLGYERLALLDGGLAGWRAAGRATTSGVNVPSKAFGEKVHHERAVPDITPEELKSLQEQSANLMILDVRTPEEYGRFCIPGGVNVPGGDLILWADELKRRPETTVIVNCAGRTRSIIGTAALRRLGLNNVRALRNGTMGWVLAGYELEKQPRRSARQAPADSRERAETLAQAIADGENLSWISHSDFTRLVGAPEAVHYIIDVRSESEYAAGHIPGSLSVPGGQAVQRADDFVAIHNAPVIFVSEESARAVMAAYWYRQMGFPNVAVLRGGIREWIANGGRMEIGTQAEEPLGFASAREAARLLDPNEVKARIERASALILDVGTSLDFEAMHLPSARWMSRGWLELKFPEHCVDRAQAIVLTCPDSQQSVLAAATLGEMGYANVAVLAGGMHAWAAAGFPAVAGVEGCLVERNDIVLSPSIRGSKEDMQRYLDWELTLPK